MADNSLIEWTDATWNPITGCSVISPGCAHCYAMRLAGTRLQHHPSREGLTVESKAGPVWNGKVRLNEDWLDQPIRWRKPRRIFVCAHGDLFHEAVPDAWIDRVFAVMALAPQHTFQVLTKRSARMRAYLTDHRTPERIGLAAAELGHCDPGIARLIGLAAKLPLPNVWLGVSAEDEPRAADRLPDLMRTPAALRYASLEPLVGRIDARRWLAAGRPATRAGTGERFLASHFFIKSCEHCGWTGSSELCGVVNYGDDADVSCPACSRVIVADELPGLDWVIVGGESATDARPMHPTWVREIRDACAGAGVAFFFKQWGTWAPRATWVPGPSRQHAIRPDGRAVRDDVNPDNVCGQRFEHVGKSAAGRELDGRTWDEFPEVRP